MEWFDHVYALPWTVSLVYRGLRVTADYSYIMYLFRMKYKGVHTIVDAAMLMGGPIAREVATVLFLLTWM